MLQLLLEGGQGYDDIGSLLGIPPDEVRSRARSALTEIGGADPDSRVGLTDYLLGQADPIGRADAVRHLQSDPDANALAQRLEQNLRLLAPKATLPEIPEAKPGRRQAPPPPPPAAPPVPGAAGPPPPAASTAREPGIASRAAGVLSGRGSLTGRRRTQAIVGGAILLVLVVVVIVLATGGGGGGSSDCKPLNVSAAQQAGVPTTKLAAVGDFAGQDCAPTGQVTLVPVSPQNQQTGKPAIAGFALQTNAAHLDPTSGGDEYVLWLYGSDQHARPIGQETVGQDGNLNGAAPLPTQELVFLQALQKIRLSLVTGAQKNQIQQALQAESKNKRSTGVVSFVGTPVLEGSGTELLQQLQQQLQQAQNRAGTSTGSKG